MNQQLAGKLATIGLPTTMEFRIEHPNAVREDGWSVKYMYQAEVEGRKKFFQELSERGLIQDPSGKTMMDLGCGTATSAVALYSSLELAVAVDASFEHCVSAVECAELAKATNVAVFQGSLLACPNYRTLPFVRQSFDLVVSFNALGRKDMLLTIPDLAGLLRPGGELCFTYPKFWLTKEGLGPDEAELRQYMESRVDGWEMVSRNSIQNLAKVAGFDWIYQGELSSLPAIDATGIIFVSTGIVDDLQGFVDLVGDFSSRWQIHLETLILRRRP